jgi:methylated-DNA-[protein]-cysteine S-methyltransferase
MPALGRPAPLGYPAAVKIAYHVMSAPAPLGLIFLAATDRGLRYAEFMDRRSIKRIIAAHEAENPGATWEASLLRLKPVVDQFEQYFCGTVMSFEVPLDPVGSEFQLECWKALSAIPFGETRTYGDIARAIGQPKAARAVGLANHDNPIVIIVPCHRVVGADGSLTGYGGGLPRKALAAASRSALRRSAVHARAPGAAEERRGSEECGRSEERRRREERLRSEECGRSEERRITRREHAAERGAGRSIRHRATPAHADRRRSRAARACRRSGAIRREEAARRTRECARRRPPSRALTLPAAPMQHPLESNSRGEVP